MTGRERRKKILEIIKKSTVPISGTELAKLCGVSRQIVVQDIALLRAEEYNIYSTTRGYLCEEPKKYIRIFCVSHKDDKMVEELNSIVDFGGVVLDVFVKHDVYGDIKAELNINSRKKVSDFIKKLNSGNVLPLKNLTSDIHYHTVEAENEEILDLIENELRNKDILYEKEER